MEINRTRTLFCDLLGLPKGKYVPPDLAKSGHIGFAKGAFATTFDRDLLTVPGTGVYDGLPDMDLFLENKRFKSWQENTEIALGVLKKNNIPFDLCSRSLLIKTIDDLDKIDLKAKVGIEYEAYVFEQDDDGVWSPYNTPGAFVYGTGPSNDPKNLIAKIWDTAYQIGIPIESMNGEYDNGQFELTLSFDDALIACDNSFLFKIMAKEIALNEGLILSFMPKPIPDRGGSGLHINFSLEDKTNSNIIAPDGKLSEIAKNCVAGLLKHHESLSALLAPTVNSYDRLQPASMAGYWANWAEDHRLVTVRTSSYTPKSSRIEHRMADGSSNPYLAVSAVLQASILGIKNNYNLPPQEDLDGLENVRATRHVPSSLKNAIAELEKDKILRKSLNELLCDAFIALKKDEAKRLEEKNIDEIREYYLPFI